jgi:outer membrane protein
VSNVRTQIDQPVRPPIAARWCIRRRLASHLFHADRWFQLKAAEAVNEQAALQLSATEQELILQSAENYFSVLRAQDTPGLDQGRRSRVQAPAGPVRERFDVGLSDKTDVLQSQASYDTARANRIVAQRQVDDAFEALITLTNRQYNAIEGMRHTLPILPPCTE